MKIITVRISGFLFALIFMASCKPAANETDHDGKMYVRAASFETANGWGYEIYANDTLYIRQPFIPSVPGRHSFETREDALRTATLAIEKMGRLHAMPRITQTDLKEIHIRIPE